MPEAVHTYPSSYGRGVDPVLDEAWDLLDAVKPGVIPESIRAFLAGAMVGLVARHVGKPGREASSG
jgi:hypothetical protein